MDVRVGEAFVFLGQRLRGRARRHEVHGFSRQLYWRKGKFEQNVVHIERGKRGEKSV